MNDALAHAAPIVAGESWPEGRLVLPGGIVDAAGRCHKTVFVRELTGADEELLADRAWRSGAEQATALLARALERVDGLDRPVDRDLAAGMLAGDRDYLLLRLRQIALGDHVHQVLRCPDAACGKKVDVEFIISELPVRHLERANAQYEVHLSRPLYADDETSADVSLRLPTGADQEALADVIDTNPGLANTRLYTRLLLRAGKRGAVTEDEARAFPLAARAELAAFVRNNAPGPDLRIEIACPHCAADMSYPFDLNAFFLPNGGRA